RRGHPRLLGGGVGRPLPDVDRVRAVEVGRGPATRRGAHCPPRRRAAADLARHTDPARSRHRRRCGPGPDGGPASLRGVRSAPRVGVEPTSLILIQSQAGPTGRPTGERRAWPTDEHSSRAQGAQRRRARALRTALTTRPLTPWDPRAAVSSARVSCNRRCRISTLAPCFFCTRRPPGCSRPPCGRRPATRTPRRADGLWLTVPAEGYCHDVDLPVMPPVQPMLATSAPRVPTKEGLLFEPKWDGFRCLVFRDGDEVELASRNTKPLTPYFPEAVEAVLRDLPERCVVDGELFVALTGEDGSQRLEFDALSERIHPAKSRVTMLAEQTPAGFVAFDLLALGDESLMDRPFAERRAMLAEALAQLGTTDVP